MTRGQRFFPDERGIIPLLLALLIGAAAFIGLGIAILGGADTAQKQQAASAGRLVQLEKRLRLYAYENDRLPCPANPDGDGNPRATCTGGNNAGIIPWKVLGLPRQDAVDDFGRMVTYIIDPALIAGDICAGGVTALAGSLAVVPGGGPRLFSLISHGPTGFGGWLPGGTQMQNPPSAIERANCASTSISATVNCVDPNTDSVTSGPFNPDITSADFFDDNVLLSNSADYNPVCSGAAPTGVIGAQVSFDDIDGTAAAGVEGRLHNSDPFRGSADELAADADNLNTSAPRVTVGSVGIPTTIRLGVPITDAPTGSSCIFLKNAFQLRAGPNNKVLRAYMEFAFRFDETTDGSRGEGMTLAFVPRQVDSGPASYRDNNQICGGEAAQLGFQYVSPNNFPDSNKFGVEFDTRQTTSIDAITVSDAPNNHIAIDRNLVTHQDLGGPKCLASAPGTLSSPPTGCTQDTTPPTSRDWMELGHTVFHKVRVDVYANGDGVLPADCGPSDVAVLVWLFENGSDCTDGCRDLTANYANTGSPATAMIKHCLPVPHDRVLVGVTAGYTPNSSEPLLRNFGITEAAE